MTTIKLKNGSGAPTAGDLVQGEPALDLTNKRLYTEDSGGTVIEVGTNPTSVTTGNITATGTATFAGLTTTADVSFGDNDKAIFGAGSDLQIYHDGSNSFITETGTGYLGIGTNGSKVIINKSPFENMAEFITDGAVNLYHNNSQKFATTSTGIDVTGTVTADGLTVQGTASATQLNILDDTATTVEASWTHADGSGTSVINVGRNSTWGGELIIQTDTKNRANFASNGDISFYNSAGTSQDLYWDASASSLGLGTTSPSAVSGGVALEAESPTGAEIIAGNSTASTVGGEFLGAFLFKNGDNSATYPHYAGMVGKASNQFGFIDLEFYAGRDVYETGGTPHLFIGGSNDDMGHVGIGTTSPSSVLHVQDTNSIVYSEGTGGYGSFYAKGSGTNAAYLFMGNAGGEKGRVQTENDGTIVFSNTTSATERMRIDSSGNVGIGTTSPAYALDVDSTIHIGNDAGSSYTHSRLILDANGASRGAGIFSHNQVNDTEWFFGSPYDTPDSFAINRQSTTTHADSTANKTNSLVTVDSSGNVGIGTTSPTSVLHVKPSVDSSAGGMAFESQDGTHKWTLDANNAGNFRLYKGTTAIARFDSAGNFGIGTSSPSSFNQVGADSLVVGSGSGEQGITIYSGTANNGVLAFADGTTTTQQYQGYIGYNHASNYMRFFTGASERMRINSSGNVGINNTNPTAPLHSNGATQYGSAAKFQNDGSATSWARVDWINDQVSGSGIVYRDQTGSFVFRNDNSSGSSMNTDIVAGGTTSGVTRFFRNSSTESMRIDSSGHAIIPAGVTLGTSVGTYVAANTLDDYEVGTWTPTLIGSTSGSATVTVTTARYTKIGSTVFVRGHISCDLSSHNIVGVVDIGGLPFSPNSQAGAGSIGYQSIASGAIHIRIVSAGLRLGKGSSTQILNTDLLTGSAALIFFEATYETNA